MLELLFGYISASLWSERQIDTLISTVPAAESTI
jgi:hypothetical protein